MNTDTTLTIFAILVALGLASLIAVESITMPQQQAEARGCKNSLAFNASQGRCFR